MKTFEQRRQDYSPYGFSCELWHPTVMGRFDHHNEIEINFIPHGSLKYFFHDRIAVLPEGSVCVFWGLLSHRIVDFNNLTSYYVVTIPIASFIKWGLCQSFINRLFSGEIIVDSSFSTEENIINFERWIKDQNNPSLSECMRLELQSRIKRIAINNRDSGHQNYIANGYPMSKIEDIILYISQNYHRPIKTSDIATAVGLNPDYAGTLFKKTLGQTITEYLMKERIANAQRAILFTDEPITQIAYMSGFNSISSFNIAFKRISDLTPREYRKLSTNISK